MHSLELGVATTYEVRCDTDHITLPLAINTVSHIHKEMVMNADRAGTTITYRKMPQAVRSSGTEALIKYTRSCGGKRIYGCGRGTAVRR